MSKFAFLEEAVFTLDELSEMWALIQELSALLMSQHVAHLTIEPPQELKSKLVPDYILTSGSKEYVHVSYSSLVTPRCFGILVEKGRLQDLKEILSKRMGLPMYSQGILRRYLELTRPKKEKSS